MKPSGRPSPPSVGPVGTTRAGPMDTTPGVTTTPPRIRPSGPSVGPVGDPNTMHRGRPSGPSVGPVG